MNRLMIKFIEKYQQNPYFHQRRHCRYYPTCSCYGLESFKRFNFFKASYLTTKRILSCNPLHKGGYDPVPEKKQKLIKVLDDVYMLPYRKATDRPNLVYIKLNGKNVLIDAGTSDKHVKTLLKELKKNKLEKPDTVIITHYHWDHTYGLNYLDATSIGSTKTNEYLLKLKEAYKISFDEPFNQKLLPMFCYDHLDYEYKKRRKKLAIKTLDVTFDDEYELNGLKIIKMPSNHTDDSYVIYDEVHKLLIASDALCGFIDGYDFIKDNNIIKKQIEFLNSLDFNLLIEGHGEVVTKNEILEDLKSDLEN